MFEFIRTYQMDIMLGLSSACFVFMLMLFFTKFLDKKRKIILIFMELIATLLLFFDRMAYIYSGDVSTKAFYMVRISNFMVFFLTASIVLCFNWHLIYLLTVEGKLEKIPRRLTVVGFASVLEMFMVIISQFTGLYYYFDEFNVYHRGPGFLICYIIPILGPLLQFTVFFQHRKLINKYVYISLVLYVFVPVIVSIIQIFTYGISIVNMAMVLVSISLYVFTYLDINDTVVRAHNYEMQVLEDEKKSMKRLFDQTATAFMSAVEKRDEYSEGHSKRVASLARRIAEKLGKSENECDEVYYSAMLHNVGLVSIPDEVLEKKEALSQEERKIIEKVPVLSSQILESIREYPYLKEAALYSHEQYDGTGYPVQLKGETIPEIARIVAVADAYDAMTSRRSYRGPLPYPTVREEFVRQAGVKFDPHLADIMVHLMDEEDLDYVKGIEPEMETEITCGHYRDACTMGISIGQEITKIRFKFTPAANRVKEFCEPALILFDSFDGLVHDNPKAVEAYHYLEYGEAWFDGHFVSTSARNMVASLAASEQTAPNQESFEIIAGKFEDHLKLELLSAKGKIQMIVALPDSSKSAFISLTGENGTLSDIQIVKTEEKVSEGDIEKIVEKASYINRMESDVANVQIDRFRSASTVGIPVGNKLRLDFHSMSLPESNLVWHCPYIVLFYSDDMRPEGESYHEYALIKLNGEISGNEGYADNKFSMKKKEGFEGWDSWKEKHKAGLECSVSMARKGNRIIFSTENLGVAIENITTLKENPKEVYAAITGDEVAITDIRIR